MQEGRTPHPYICVQCGTQHQESADPPPACAVCEDDRQFVRWDGQAWTTMEELGRDHSVRIADDHGLMGVGMEPSFAIGQRALLVPFGESNLLWDCIPLLTRSAVEKVHSLGGIRAIAVSHPHFYASVVEWSDAFGGVPIFLHSADRHWVMRPWKTIEHWESDALELGEGLTLHRLGGHFPGGTVLHWEGGADGRGALLTGDILQVGMDRRWVSFMYSYPNLIPLPVSTVRTMTDWVKRLEFDRIYGGWWGRNILSKARAAVASSANRYAAALEGPGVLSAARR